MVTDTIKHDLLDAYDRQLRGWSATPPSGVTLERDGPVLRVVGLHQGFVTGPRDLGLEGPELDQLIARQRVFFEGRGEPVEWKTRAHDTPADLTDHLRAAGFQPEEPETVLIGEARALATDPTLPDGVSIRQVTDPADMRRIAAMQSIVWDADRGWLAEELTRAVASTPDEVVVLVAEAAGVVVSSCRLTLDPGTDFAGMWGGATLPEWRGRGVYRATVAARAQLAVAHGHRYVYVDASPDSAPILSRLGLHAVTTTTPYVWTPAA